MSTEANGAAAASATTSASTAATNGAAATNGTSNPSTTQQGSGQASTDWTTTLNDELKGYVQTKGFKDPTAVLESYRNFERLQGVPQDRLLKLPENLDSPEGQAIFEKLGAPKDAKDYNITIPKEHGDEALSNWLREVAGKNRWTNKQVENLVTAWNERSSTTLKAQQEAQQAMLSQADQNLKKEWGAAYEQNKTLADQGAIAIGMGEKEVQALGQALGPDKAMMLLHKLATATGEHSFVTGRPAAGDTNTPEQAKMRLKELQHDSSFYRRLMSGDADAKRLWTKLNQEAAPGTMSL